MRKTARARQSQRISEDADVLVANAAKLRASCRRAIQRVLKGQTISFDKTDTSHPTREMWCIRSPEATGAQAKYAYTVVPLPVLTPTRYWVGVSLEFHRERARRNAAVLTGVTIIIVAGDAADPQKRELLRIDWDCRPGYTGSEHAQPHWHVHPGWPTSMEGIQHAGFPEEGGIMEFAPPTDYAESGEPSGDMEFVPAATNEWTDDGPAKISMDVARFHFALAAQWHVGNGRNPTLTEKQLPAWIEGCIAYTQAQLAYLHRKAGKTAG